MQHFEEVLFFKLLTTKKQKNKQLIQRPASHSYVLTGFRSDHRVACTVTTGEMHQSECSSQCRAVFLPPASHVQLTQDKLN